MTSADDGIRMDKLNTSPRVQWNLVESVIDLIKDGRIVQAPDPHPLYKGHWDFLLQEMTWMAVDFYEERKWKVHAARQVSRLVRGLWKERERANRTWAAAQWSQAVQEFWGGIMTQVCPAGQDRSVADDQFGVLTNGEDKIFKSPRSSCNSPSMSKQLYSYCLTTIAGRLIESGVRIDSSVVDSLIRAPPIAWRTAIEVEHSTIDDTTPLEPLGIEVFPVAPLWTDSIADPRSYRDGKDYAQAKEVALELAVHSHQEQGVFMHPMVYRPPDPQIDAMNLRAMGCSDYDENSLFLHFYLSSIEGIANFFYRKRKLDPGFDIADGLTNMATSADSRKRKSRKKIQKRNVLSNAEPNVSGTDFSDSYGFDEYELAVLRRYVALYTGSGRKPCQDIVCVNWKLVALSLTNAMKASAVSHLSRTAAHCKKRFYALEQEGTSAVFTLPDPPESLYRAMVYNFAPPTYFSTRQPTNPFTLPKPEQERYEESSWETEKRLDESEPERRSTTDYLPRPSLVQTTLSLFNQVVRNPGISVEALIPSDSTRTTSAVGQYQASKLLRLSSVVSRFGNNMKKRSLSNQNFAEAFQLSSKLPPDVDPRNPKNIAPLHPSHGKVSHLANQNLSQYFAAPSYSPTEHMAEEDGFMYRNHPNCALQVRLADYTQERLRQFPFNFNAATRTRKPQVPDFPPPDEIIRNQAALRQSNLQDLAAKQQKQQAPIGPAPPSIQQLRQSPPSNNLVSQRGNVPLPNPAITSTPAFSGPSRPVGPTAPLTPYGNNTPVNRPLQIHGMLYTPSPSPTKAASGGSRGGLKKVSDPSSPPATKRKRGTSMVTHSSLASDTSRDPGSMHLKPHGCN